LPILDAHRNPLSAYNPQWRTSRPAEVVLEAAPHILNIRRYHHKTVPIRIKSARLRSATLSPTAENHHELSK